MRIFTRSLTGDPRRGRRACRWIEPRNEAISSGWTFIRSPVMSSRAGDQLWCCHPGHITGRSVWLSFARLPLVSRVTHSKSSYRLAVKLGAPSWRINFEVSTWSREMPISSRKSPVIWWSRSGASSRRFSRSDRHSGRLRGARLLLPWSRLKLRLTPPALLGEAADRREAGSTRPIEAGYWQPI